MKLTIALFLSRVVLTFTTPGPGSYYVIRHDTPWSVCVVASGYETNVCTVAVELPNEASVGLHTLKFYPGSTNPE